MIDEGSRESVKAVFYHEKGHENQGLIKYGNIGTYLLSPPLAVLWLLLIPALGYSVYANSEILNIFLFESSSFYLGLSVLIVISSFLASYITELDAEFYCIREIGLEKYEKGRKNIDMVFGEKNLVEKFFIHIHHPSTRVTVFLYRIFAGVEKQ